MLAAHSPACCFIVAPFALFVAHKSFLVQFLHPCKTIFGNSKSVVPHIPAFLSIKRNRCAWIKVNRLFRSFGYVPLLRNKNARAGVEVARIANLRSFLNCVFSISRQREQSIFSELTLLRPRCERWCNVSQLD